MRNHRTAALLSTFAIFACRSALATIITFGSGANQFTLDFVTIGNPGNAADTTGDPSPAGAVPYVYMMGTYEVSRDMVTKANVNGSLAITLIDMTGLGGNVGTHPAGGTSWNEAARFVNWLNTSQGYSPAYKFALQPGDVGYNSNANILLWQSGDPGFNAANRFRNSLAHYWLPSIDEWYKAAFYDPNKLGPGLGGYWDYPTGSDSLPTPVASGTAPGTAVYEQPIEAGPADVTQAGGLSPYGTMAQGGNFYEWQETESDFVNDSVSSPRDERGGGWSINGNLAPKDLLSSLRRGGSTPSNQGSIGIGFRVAAAPLPEPSSLTLAAVGFGGLVAAWRRRR